MPQTEVDTSGPAGPLGARKPPLVVDLDHTLLLTDTLDEHAALGLFSSPGALVGVARKAVAGRAALKAALVDAVPFDVDNLPLRADLVAWLRDEAATGRAIHLCSAAHTAIVEGVGRRLGFFTSAVGSDGVNLKGPAKADHLARTFPEGFVYAGDSAADLVVWSRAQGIVLAGASPATAKAARALGKPIEAEFETAPLTARQFARALRVHHWSKNALIFVPLVLGHVFTVPAVAHVALGLVCLLMVTSSTYLLNDIADLDADRLHRSKRTRALASGALPVRIGFLIAGIGIGMGMVGAFALAPAFALALGSYVVLTMAYSFRLKQIPLLDTLVIGILFMTRLVMGMSLLDQPPAEWLLAFALFFFFSLALAKRHTEILGAVKSETNSLGRRGYLPEDEPLTLALGVSSAVASLIIMTLFIVEEVHRRNAYHHPTMLWFVPLMVAIWVGRIWLLAHRGLMADDPVSFALRDRPSLAIGAATALSFLSAL